MALSIEFDDVVIVKGLKWFVKRLNLFKVLTLYFEGVSYRHQNGLYTAMLLNALLLLTSICDSHAVT